MELILKRNDESLKVLNFDYLFEIGSYFSDNKIMFKDLLNSGVTIEIKGDCKWLP